jgi:hypothetical protein
MVIVSGDKSNTSLWEYQGVGCVRNPIVIVIRRSSTRLAQLDQFEGAPDQHRPGGDTNGCQPALGALCRPRHPAPEPGRSRQFESHPWWPQLGWIAYGLGFTGLFLGAIFFAYAVRYYLSTAIVLITSLATGGRAGNENGHNWNGHNGNGKQRSAGLVRTNGNGNVNGFHLDLGYHPFVSAHVAAYNEKRVIERLLTAPGTASGGRD